MVSNIGKITDLAGTPSKGLVDGTDKLHSGIIKALESFSQDNMCVSHAGFTITDGGDYTQYNLAQPIKFRANGQYVSYTGGNLTVAYSSTVQDGTNSRYDWVLLNPNIGGTPAIVIVQGTAGTTPLVSDITAGYIPIALVHITAGTDNDKFDYSFQTFTMDLSKNSISIGRDSSGYTESLSIVSNAGNVEIEAKEQDKDIIFKANDGGVSKEVMRIDGSVANVGIGTTSPMNKLQVSHTGVDGNNGILIVRDDDPTVENEILGGIGFDSTDGNVPSSVLEASVYIAAFAAESHGVGDKGGDLTFGTAAIDDNDDTASTEHMRITDNGNVGIGTDSPTTKLHVKTSGADDAVIIESTEAGATDAPDLVLYRNSASPAVSDEIGSIRFRGKDSSAGDKDYNRITSVIRDNTAASADADLIFQSLSNSVEIEMMKISRIDGIVINEIGASYIDTRIEGDTDANLFFTDASVDRVGIGTNTPTQKLTVSGSISSSSYHGSVVEITGSGLPTGSPPAPVPLLNLNSDTHRTIIADTQASAPNPPNALTLNLPAASGTHQGWEMKIICKNNAGGVDDLVITPAGSDELVSATGAVIGNNSTPFSLTTGKIYTVIHISATQYMAIQLN